MPKNWACGVDACADGWFYVLIGAGDHVAEKTATFLSVVERVPADTVILVDMPIGLPGSRIGARRCDSEARANLGKRHVCVFSVPARVAVYASDFDEARRLNKAALGRGLTKQSWALTPRIREVDEILRRRPDLRERIREVHPEVCFWGLTGRPIEEKKTTREGYEQRVAALAAVEAATPQILQQAIQKYCGFGVSRDDVVDALVAAICAKHIDECRTLPEEVPTDAEGLRMEMVYWPADQ